MLAGLVVNGKLDLICFVHINVVVFSLPPVIAGASSPCHDLVLDLDSNKSIRGATKTPGRCMVDVFDTDNAER